MQSYELMVIISPELGEKHLQNELGEIRDMIAKSKGKLLNEDIHGLRDLAYRIKKHDRGFYAVFNFELDGPEVKKLERELNLQQPVLRFLMTKNPTNYVFTTLAEYDQEYKKMLAEREEGRKKSPVQNRRKKIEPAAEEKTESEPAPKAHNKSTKKEDVDKKIDSIVDDPDITL